MGGKATMKIKVYIMNSFAETAEGGNLAGVVFDADNLSEEDMKSIAGKLGFSETAFVMSSDKADFRLRFFTPTEEVDLCGHATIGTFYTMSKLHLLEKGNYKQETNQGILGVEICDHNFIMMEQFVPELSEIIDKKEIAESLNIDVSQIPSDLPVQIVSTGLRDILVPVKSIEILNNMQPDMDKITEISRKYNVIGYHVFALEVPNGANAYCRNFAPLYNITEEAATGTSNGALAGYLYHYGKVTKKQAAHLVFKQGYSMKKPSEIRASLEILGDEIKRVKVGGSAQNLRLVEIEYC